MTVAVDKVVAAVATWVSSVVRSVVWKLVALRVLYTLSVCRGATVLSVDCFSIWHTKGFFSRQEYCAIVRSASSGR